MINEDDFWSNWWNGNWQGKPKYSEKTYPSATLSTTKSHMTDPVSLESVDGGNKVGLQLNIEEGIGACVLGPTAGLTIL
jgi:hypothetical protein